MSNPDNPKSPYSPNDPRNPRNPTNQKNPGNPNDPKNPKDPFHPLGTQTPQESGSEGYGHSSNAAPQHLDSSALQSRRADHKMIQSSDIVALLQNKGKVTLNGQILTLKEPPASDPRLQEIIKESTLSVTPIGKSSESGVSEYELKSSSRIVTIKIDCKKS